MNQDLYNEQCRDGLDYCPECSSASFGLDNCHWCGAEMYPEEESGPLNTKNLTGNETLIALDLGKAKRTKGGHYDIFSLITGEVLIECVLAHELWGALRGLGLIR